MPQTNLNNESLYSIASVYSFWGFNLHGQYNLGPFKLSTGLYTVIQAKDAGTFTANIIIVHACKYVDGDHFCGTNGKRPGKDGATNLQVYYSVAVDYTNDIIYLASYDFNVPDDYHISKLDFSSGLLPTVNFSPVGPTNVKYGNLWTHAPYMSLMPDGRLLLMIEQLNLSSTREMEYSIYDPVDDAWDSTEVQLYIESAVVSAYAAEYPLSPTFFLYYTFNSILSTDGNYLHTVAVGFDDSVGEGDLVLVYFRVNFNTGAIENIERFEDSMFDEQINTQSRYVSHFQDFTNSSGNREFMFMYLKRGNVSGDYTVATYRLARIVVDGSDNVTITTEEIFAPSGTLIASDPDRNIPLVSAAPYGENNENIAAFYTLEDTDKGTETFIKYKTKENGTWSSEQFFKEIDYNVVSLTAEHEYIGYAAPRANKVGDYKIGVHYFSDSPVSGGQTNLGAGVLFYDLLDLTPGEGGVTQENSAWID